MDLLYYFCWIIYGMSIPRMLHIMQLESYQTDGFYRWILKNPKKAFKGSGLQFLVVAGMFLLSTLVLIILPKFNVQLNSWALYIQFALIAISFFVSNTILISKDKKERKTAKKPLKYTARAKRLLFSNLMVMAFLEVIFSEFFGIGLNSRIYELNFVEFLK